MLNQRKFRKPNCQNLALIWRQQSPYAGNVVTKASGPAHWCSRSAASATGPLDSRRWVNWDNLHLIPVCCTFWYQMEFSGLLPGGVRQCAVLTAPVPELSGLVASEIIMTTHDCVQWDPQATECQKSAVPVAENTRSCATLG